ncbi:MAG: diaminopimelate decarboxylase [Bacteroidales bacterium]|nr:MAG: diaminopimelate decarboxylase [Bacteroidales bacterium]
MNYIHALISRKLNFYGNTNPVELTGKYGSPLYVYNESVIRSKCSELKGLTDYPDFVVNYSPKANSNVEILKIVKDEGLLVDAVSSGEIFTDLMAGYSPEDIFYVCNNVTAEELSYAIDARVKISVDSISQLELFGKLNPGGEVSIRINPGVGTGHHKKVVTGGQSTKFGIDIKLIEDVKRILNRYNLTLSGLNQHIGSLFMDSGAYLKSAEIILDIARQFNNLKFIDFGGGFGIPYNKQNNESRLDLKTLGEKLTQIINNWIKEYGRQVTFIIEPGRYIVAESAVLLGSVTAIKLNYNIKYIGTDIGFNVLPRPMIYDSHHDIEIYRESDVQSAKSESVWIVGNMCETGDIIAKDRTLPEIFENDIIGILDSGAYAYSMSSNYNNRLRPAEVLIDINGNDRLIRKKETFEDLVDNFT